jgi:hypothetical protein
MKKRIPKELPTTTKVWIIEKELAVQYLGVNAISGYISVWFLIRTSKSKVGRIVPADQVFSTRALALASLTKKDCWFVDGDRVMPAKGYRRSSGKWYAFDKSGCEIIFRTIFSTKGKAERYLFRTLRAEKRCLATRIRRISIRLSPGR